MAQGGKINSIIELLNSHRGRDSIIRTASYLSLYLSSYARGNTSRKLKTISEELSYCRLIMRLFDDFPMLHFTLNYGLGSQEKTILMRVLGVVKNLLDQVYYPVEHVAWAAEKRLVKANSYILYTAGAALWGLSSYISIVRYLIHLAS
ncbi:peroxisomal membrane protein 11C [Trichonephila clavipes]|nr:peroxisomal membrane protein 11C [Trichonephila clavipes]